jgi:predicted enzyme related to lactoylglutathione lyase
MSERDEYPAGVPCWVETLQADPQAAMAFYASLFGWEFEGPGEMPGDRSDASDGYYVAKLRGRDVAGIGSMKPRGEPRTPAWTTYVRVDGVAETAERAIQAGGNVLVAPMDAPPAGSLAILTDPAGAPFGVWEPQERQGAQRVHEPSAWSMSSLHTNDTEAAKSFYGTLFGWETQPFGDAGIALFRLPGYDGGQPAPPVPRDTVACMFPILEAQISIGPDPQIGSSSAQRPRWNVDFWIDGVDTGAERARASGGKVLATLDVDEFHSADLADPAGAVFSISQLMIEPSRSR